MNRTTLQTKDGGHMAFGIDTMLSTWFVMVFAPEAHTPHVYQHATTQGHLIELINEHAVDSPEKDAKLLAIALDLNPAEAVA